MTTGAAHLGARGMTASDQLARHSRITPDRTALRCDGGGLSYRELDERVSRLANALAALGVRRGERVSVLGLNSAQVIESYLAVVRLGGVCVPLNFRLVADELAYALNDSGSVAVIVDAALAPTLAKARQRAPEARICVVIDGGVDEYGDGEYGDGEYGVDYERVLGAADATNRQPELDEHAAAFIMYTSGTTGRPKGAVLTHSNLLLHAFSSNVHLGVGSDDRITLSGAPLFHIAGVSGYLMALLPAGTFVITRSGGFNPEEIVELLALEHVSSCFFVPAQWQAICAVADLRERDLSALRRISWGAAPASKELLRKMINTFPGTQVVTAFGQTECSPVTCYLRGEDAIRKIGSVGTPMLNVEARIVDDDMNDVPRGEVGEIVYRGPMVMKEYWNKPEDTEAAFAGGWFHSGDLVREDEDGYYYVVDRKKDMIISGGENIYCAEVETVLSEHPKIAEVALVGVPDPRWGETPLAVVIPKDPADPPTVEDIEGHSREHLAGFKRPRHLALIEALPRNPSGKVLKTTLRARYAAGELASQRTGYPDRR